MNGVTGIIKNITRSRVTKQVEALTDFDDHLQFMHELIDGSDLPGKDQHLLTQQLNIIESRSRDPNLYLAVIGEFNSGKSTLVNALIRDTLLKVSVTDRTSVPTWLKYGKQLQVDVGFSKPEKAEISINGKTHRVLFSDTTPDDLLPQRYNDRQNMVSRFLEDIRYQSAGTKPVIEIPWLTGIRANDPKELIQIITTDPDIAPNVNSVTITHQARFLSKGIVIIDTPGTNFAQVGELDDGVKTHIEITRKVVGDDADAAIIVIPYDQPVSLSLTDFLREAIPENLHRCIFILTKIDQIYDVDKGADEYFRERDSLLQTIRNRLQSQLNLSDLELYSCAAKSVITEENNRLSSLHNTWQEQFLDLEEHIQKYMSNQHALCIAENLARLMNSLFKSLDEQLKQQWQKYQQNQLSIQEKMIPDLRVFATQQHKKCKAKLLKVHENVYSDITKQIDSYRSDVILGIRNLICSAQDRKQLDEILSNRIKVSIAEMHNGFSRELEKALMRMNNETLEIGTEFDREFQAAYKRLQSLRYLATSIPNTSTSPVTSVAFIKIEAKDPWTESYKTSLTSAAVGAAVGSIAGPVGTLFGAISGWFIGFIFSPSIEKLHDKAWIKVEPALNQYLDGLSVSVFRETDLYAEQLTQWLSKKIDAHVSYYGNLVDQIKREQSLELERLNNLQGKIERDLSEINRRREELNSKLESMKNTDSILE